MGDLVEKIGSRYLLVNVVARRAREIATECEENCEPSDEKPVSEAIAEIFHDELIVTDCGDSFAKAAPVVFEEDLIIE